MSSPVQTPTAPRITIVLQNPDQLKDGINAKTDTAIEKIGEVVREGIKYVVPSAQPLAPFVGEAIKKKIDPHLPRFTTFVAHPTINFCVEATAEHIDDTVKESIDNCIDSSETSSKKFSHRSTDTSIDTSNSCLKCTEQKVNSSVDPIFSCFAKN
ncbi:MAG: hypothetical protein K1000chlam3_00857 [Chlamydiae bacterium]|nr:hypothetical protein [Chlamydiota bacterium]